MSYLWRDWACCIRCELRYKLSELQHNGEPVESAKPNFRAKIIEANDAFMYAEPESKVISPPGDVCIVAWMDQWYL